MKRNFVEVLVDLRCQTVIMMHAHHIGVVRTDDLVDYIFVTGVRHVFDSLRCSFEYLFMSLIRNVRGDNIPRLASPLETIAFLLCRSLDPYILRFVSGLLHHILTIGIF